MNLSTTRRPFADPNDQPPVKVGSTFRASIKFAHAGIQAVGVVIEIAHDIFFSGRDFAIHALPIGNSATPFRKHLIELLA